jgi:hypothetical protein
MAEEKNVVDRCESCNGEDDHPKFHVIGPTPDGLGWSTYHHDCAALLGHAKASVIVEHAKGVKGDELRKLLADKKHPVHKAVADFSHQESKDIEQRNQRLLEGDK